MGRFAKQAMFWSAQNPCSLHSKIENSLCSFQKMARPKLPQKEKRDIKFTFKMNELELQALAELTEYSNLSPTEVIRSCVFKNRLLKAKIPVVDMNTYLELKKIGTNINQIAKQYNSGKEVPADKLRVFISLKVKLDSILNKLIDDR
tara:strand:+ start:116282 stop:116722 length:441 start_codon:yes stop_codon:yes gene_type:complete